MGSCPQPIKYSPAASNTSFHIVGCPPSDGAKNLPCHFDVTYEDGTAFQGSFVSDVVRLMPPSALAPCFLPGSKSPRARDTCYRLPASHLARGGSLSARVPIATIQNQYSDDFNVEDYSFLDTHMAVGRAGRRKNGIGRNGPASGAVGVMGIAKSALGCIGPSRRGRHPWDELHGTAPDAAARAADRPDIKGGRLVLPLLGGEAEGGGEGWGLGWGVGRPPPGGYCVEGVADAWLRAAEERQDDGDNDDNDDRNLITVASPRPKDRPGGRDGGRRLPKALDRYQLATHPLVTIDPVDAARMCVGASGCLGWQARTAKTAARDGTIAATNGTRAAAALSQTQSGHRLGVRPDPPVGRRVVSIWFPHGPGGGGVIGVGSVPAVGRAIRYAAAAVHSPIGHLVAGVEEVWPADAAGARLSDDDADNEARTRPHRPRYVVTGPVRSPIVSAFYAVDVTGVSVSVEPSDAVVAKLAADTPAAPHGPIVWERVWDPQRGAVGHAQAGVVDRLADAAKDVWGWVWGSGLPAPPDGSTAGDGKARPTTAPCTSVSSPPGCRRAAVGAYLDSGTASVILPGPLLATLVAAYNEAAVRATGRPMPSCIWTGMCGLRSVPRYLPAVRFELRKESGPHAGGRPVGCDCVPIVMTADDVFLSAVAEVVGVSIGASTASGRGRGRAAAAASGRTAGDADEVVHLEVASDGADNEAADRARGRAGHVAGKRAADARGGDQSRGHHPQEAFFFSMSRAHDGGPMTLGAPVFVAGGVVMDRSRTVAPIGFISRRAAVAAAGPDTSDPTPVTAHAASPVGDSDTLAGAILSDPGAIRTALEFEDAATVAATDGALVGTDHAAPLAGGRGRATLVSWWGGATLDAGQGRATARQRDAVATQRGTTDGTAEVSRVAAYAARLAAVARGNGERTRGGSLGRHARESDGTRQRAVVTDGSAADGASGGVMFLDDAAAVHPLVAASLRASSGNPSVPTSRHVRPRDTGSQVAGPHRPILVVALIFVLCAVLWHMRHNAFGAAGVRRRRFGVFTYVS